MLHVALEPVGRVITEHPESFVSTKLEKDGKLQTNQLLKGSMMFSGPYKMNWVQSLSLWWIFSDPDKLKFIHTPQTNNSLNVTSGSQAVGLHQQGQRSG